MIKFLITKCINQLTALQEFTDTQVASSLLGYKSYFSSHSFWYCFVPAAVNYQRELHNDEDDDTDDDNNTIDDEYTEVRKTLKSLGYIR